MSTKEVERNSFPPLQTRIILHLAKNGPQTINETVKGISGHYKSSWIAFNVLKKKKLIKEVESKSYRERQYPRFWLTDAGICLALYERAEPQTLLRTTQRIYPENKDAEFLIQAVPILGKHALDVLYLAALKGGKFEQKDLTPIFARQMQEGFTSKQKEQFIAVTRKYPRVHQQVLDRTNDIRKAADELVKLLKQDKDKI